MANAGYLFLSNELSVIEAVGEPAAEQADVRMLYKILNTGVESLYSLISHGEELLLNQVYTDGRFAPGTYELEQEFTSWTFEFPEAFILALSHIHADQVVDIAAQWVEIEDCPYGSESELVDLINSLRALAIRSAADQIRLFLRIEL